MQDSSGALQVGDWRLDKIDIRGSRKRSSKTRVELVSGQL